MTTLLVSGGLLVDELSVRSMDVYIEDGRVQAILPPGHTRAADRVLDARGLHVLPDGCTHVAVHDSARALVTPEVIARAVAEGLEHGAAIAAIPQADTLKQGTLGVITGTVSRAGLWAAQTPQVFRRDWLERAHREASEVATDDAALVEWLGHPVRLAMGDSLNFKITTPTDLALAESWLTQRAAEKGATA